MLSGKPALSNTHRLIVTLLFVFISSPAWGVDCSGGNISLSTQAEVDNFQATYGGGGVCDTVTGGLQVTGSEITNLDGLGDINNVNGALNIAFAYVLANVDGLSGLTSIGERIYITGNTLLPDLDGLVNITGVSGRLEVSNNSTLTNLDGLVNISSVGEDLYITDNPALTDLDGLSGITSVLGSLYIAHNPKLTNLDGVSGITSLGSGTFNTDTGLNIINNTSLTNISGLANLTQVDGEVHIMSNAALVNLNGLSQLTSVGGEVIINSNDSLISIEGLANLTSVGGKLNLASNDVLRNVNGLAGLASVPGDLVIGWSSALLNVDGLAGLTEVGGNLNISWGSALTNIDGLAGVSNIGGYLKIERNDQLRRCSAFAALLGWPEGPPLDSIEGAITIAATNAAGCNSVQQILDSVSGPTAPTIFSSSATTGQVSLSFSPSSSNDDLWPITGYQAQCLSEDMVFENESVIDIPDLDSVDSNLSVTGVPVQNADSLKVTVNITHARPRHLTLTLESPSGTSAILWDEAAGDGEDIVGTFPVTLDPAESLDAFDGESFNGEWRLSIADGVSSYTGTLNSWGIAVQDRVTESSAASPITVSGLSDGFRYSCAVSAVTGLGLGQESNSVEVNCLPGTCTTETFSIGGGVIGLAGSGLVLQNNLGDDLPVAEDGSFTFPTPMVDGSNYEVTVKTQPTNLSQTCSVSNGSGTVAGADISNVSINCVTNSFTVGGTVSGLAGSGLVLQNNLGDDLPVTTNGSFTFATPLGDGSSYAVTVSVQPSNPNQICVVSNANGILAGTDIADVVVTCDTLRDHFVTTWKTDNPGTSNSTSIIVPMLGGPYDVDWDNDGVFDEFGLHHSTTHDFGVAGEYTIRIRGDYSSIRMNNNDDAEKIISVDQWGANAWTTMYRAFTGAINLRVGATDTPDFSAVTNMADMFGSAVLANPVTTGWDTAAVTDMSGMFYGAISADPDTTHWITSSVTSMYEMFAYADIANPDTSGWETSAVTNMARMFFASNKADPDTSGWDTSAVENMSMMFFEALVANPDTSGWITSNVISMASMFQGAVSASPNTSNWDMSSVENMYALFSDATSAAPDTSGWNTSRVTNMAAMFNGVVLANPDTSGWDTSLVTDMSAMFEGATLADPDTSGWNTSSVTNMEAMFNRASSANPAVSGWDTSSVTTMQAMFWSATSFDRDVGVWDVTSLVTAEGMFNNVSLSSKNYESLLTSWDSQDLQMGVDFSGGNSTYCSATAHAARERMMTADGWVITDGGRVCDPVIFSDGFEN